MSEETPLVSVIVPAYNAEKYIEEAIQSVVDQAYQNWELIIVDDGSTDATSQIIASFEDKRILLIEQENAGVSAARNRGLSEVKGKYITFLDADDVLPPQSLKARVEYLESHPDVDLVDGYINVKDIDMKSTVRTYEPYYHGSLLPRLVALDSRVFFNVCYMFKSSVLEDIRFNEDMTHAEDLLFYIELSNKSSVQYRYVTEIIYYYREGNMSAMTNLQGLEDGYIRLINHVIRLEHISNMEKYLLRLKIIKIMFLSWFHQGQVRKALKSIFLFAEVN